MLKPNNFKLFLESCIIGYQGIMLFQKALTNCPKLEYLMLDLSYNRFFQQGGDYLGEIISQSQNQKKLFINLYDGGQQFTKYACILGQAISKISTLTELQLDLREDLVGNFCDEEDFYEEGTGNNNALELSQAISNQKNLIYLNLNLYSHYGIDENGMKYLGQGISKCLNLIHLILDLQSNPMALNNFIEFTKIIVKCSNLTTIEIIIRIKKIGQNLV